MTEHTHNLEELDIFEISLVDEPANPDARVALFKRAPKEEMIDVSVDANASDASAVSECLSEEEVGLFKRFLKFFARAESEPNASATDVQKDAEMANESVREDVEKALTEKAAAVAEKEALQKRLDESEAEKAELAKALETQKTEAHRAEVLKRAGEDFSAIAKAEDVAAVLLAAEALDADAQAKLAGLLKAANARIEKGALFEETGSSETEVSASDRLEATAKRLREETPSLTREQAIAKAVAQDPSLYEAYRAERQGQE